MNKERFLQEVKWLKLCAYIGHQSKPFTKWEEYIHTDHEKAGEQASVEALWEELLWNEKHSILSKEFLDWLH